MRSLLLIVTITAAAQLPARDVSHASGQVRLSTAAIENACGKRPSLRPGYLLAGPTLFAPAGRIA